MPCRHIVARAAKDQGVLHFHRKAVNGMVLLFVSPCLLLRNLGSAYCWSGLHLGWSPHAPERQNLWQSDPTGAKSGPGPFDTNRGHGKLKSPVHQTQGWKGGAITQILHGPLATALHHFALAFWSGRVVCRAGACYWRSVGGFLFDSSSS